MYHDYLLFLLSIYAKEEPSSANDESMETTETYVAEEDIEIEDKKIIIELQEKVPPQENGRKRKAVLEKCDAENGFQPQMDEDQAFLWSLLPTMKELNREDNFQFRIDVMQLLQKYKMQSRMQELQSSLNNR